MKTPKVRGKNTSFSRELKPELQLNVASNMEDFEPEVPTEITYAEKAVEGQPSRCGLILRFGGKREPMWTNAEQLLGLCVKEGKEIAEAFYSKGKVLCNIAVGVLKGRIIVQAAA